MAINLQASWDSLSARVGIGEESSKNIYDSLVSMYSVPGRYYHNLSHISLMLGFYEEFRSYAGDPDDLELAVWFHDSICLPEACDNEEKSAELALNMLRGAGLRDASLSNVSKNILATKQAQPRMDFDSRLMRDLDICNLSLPFEEFRAITDTAIQENSSLGEEISKNQAISFFERLDKRSSIYQTYLFETMYEPRARENVRQMLGLLKGV
jgi:predicted metal-dependent HD superfamily phosphohydrolase